ncbi:hypothetical protein [Caminibacter pacificus]|uniref:Uncharacterized protein n=1 Tax=Caminibacter pacificus TaxID=1424653 RepID=A0AAJ4RAP3_9BACT|nr:hypothetical protein [Caminibacter pacificus]QDD68146.1 hypothetical protein C6V80_09845 [Caminibacter pacificus]ROR38764.1 hypothetical protein EDC58_1979 [Caminibacter pacificus]
MLNVKNEPLYLIFGIFDDLILKEELINNKELIEFKKYFDNDYDFVKYLITLDFIEKELDKKGFNNIYSIPMIFDFMIQVSNKLVNSEEITEYKSFEMIAYIDDYLNILRKVKKNIIEGNLINSLYFYNQAMSFLRKGETIIRMFLKKVDFTFIDEIKDMNSVEFNKNPFLLKINELECFEGISTKKAVEVPLSYIVFEINSSIVEENIINFFKNYKFIRYAMLYPEKIKNNDKENEIFTFFVNELREELSNYDFYKEDKYTMLIDFQKIFKKKTFELLKKYPLDRKQIEKLEDIFFDEVKKIIRQKVS